MSKAYKLKECASPYCTRVFWAARTGGPWLYCCAECGKAARASEIREAALHRDLCPWATGALRFGGEPCNSLQANPFD